MRNVEHCKNNVYKCSLVCDKMFLFAMAAGVLSLLKTLHTSWLLIISLSVWDEPECGSGWFLSGDGFSVQLKSPPRKVKPSLSQFLRQSFKMFKNTALSTALAGGIAI